MVETDAAVYCRFPRALFLFSYTFFSSTLLFASAGLASAAVAFLAALLAALLFADTFFACASIAGAALFNAYSGVGTFCCFFGSFLSLVRIARNHHYATEGNGDGKYFHFHNIKL